MKARLKLVPCLLIAVLIAGPSAALSAQGFPAHCAGTYLMAEGGGATSLWTLEADGAFFATSSIQPLVNFSDQQGSWEQDGASGAKGVVLALVFNEDNTLHDVSRVDATFHTVGNGCGTIAGSLVVRAFEDGEDPLDPSTDDEDPIATDTFTGRRVKAIR
jgi:hypothetical protein